MKKTPPQIELWGSFFVDNNPLFIGDYKRIGVFRL